MEKQSFWAHVNRGAVLALLLAVAVCVYCVGAWAMKKPDYQAVQTLCGEVEAIAAEQLALTPAEAEARIQAADPEQRQRELADRLKPFFAETGDELLSAALQLDVLLGDDRIVSGGPTAVKVQSKSLEEDTAQMAVVYTLERAQPQGPNEHTELHLSLICKRVGSTWKIHRVSELAVWITSHY